MRRAALLFAGAAIWLFLFAIPVMADNGPHVRGQASRAQQGSCASCHRAHSGQEPDLIRAAMPNVCYVCHGAGGTGASSDVQDGVGYLTGGGLTDPGATHAGTMGPGGGTSVTASSTVRALRGGGFEYALIATDTLAAQPSTVTTNNSILGRVANIPPRADGQVATSAHSVDGSTTTMWGAGPDGMTSKGRSSVSLTCGSCHDPHGNGQYRILRTTPGDAWVAAPSDWKPLTAYTVGDLTVNQNGHLYVVTVAGTSGGSAPVWPTSSPATTVGDGTVTWLDKGVMGNPATWAASTAYKVGDRVTTKSTSHYFVATVAGTSGVSAPAWPTTGGTVVDGGTLTWRDLGVAILSVKINDATTKTYWTDNYGQYGQFVADAAESPLNTDVAGASLTYNPDGKVFTGTYFEASSRWCTTCHTRYMGFTGSAGNKLWTEDGTADSVYKFRHATRNIVDPTTNGAVTNATLNPISAFSQNKNVADPTVTVTLGNYTGVSATNVWTASKAYTVGNTVRPAAYVAGQHVYVATVAGTSGVSAPVWPTDGTTVADGGVTWKDLGADAQTYRGVAIVDNVTSGLTSSFGAGDRLTTGAPRCITCHVSHGSNATAGTYVEGQTSLVTGGTLGSTNLRLDGRSVCQSCHAK